MWIYKVEIDLHILTVVEHIILNYGVFSSDSFRLALYILKNSKVEFLRYHVRRLRMILYSRVLVNMQ